MRKIMPKTFYLPKIIGHRGAKAHAPENTLVSFAMAQQAGARWVETDVKESADGVLLLMHDDEIDRTSNGQGKVSTLSWEQLLSCDAGAWFSPKFKGEKIPSLDEAVTLFKKIGLGVNLEIKPCPGKTHSTSTLIAHFIKDKWPKDVPAPLVSSFDQQALEVVREILPKCNIGLLFENFLPTNWLETARTLDAYSVHVDNDFVTREIIEEIKNAGYFVLVYTVNCQKRAEELFSWGVSSIFTDDPWQ